MHYWPKYFLQQAYKDAAQAEIKPELPGPQNVKLRT